MSADPRRRITMRQFDRRLLDIEIKIEGLEAIMQSILDQANRLELECGWLKRQTLDLLNHQGTA